MSNPRLEGKVAIITGGASGIGEAATKLFSSHGATVIIADIQDALGQTLAASIKNCTYRHCDVTDEKQVEETITHALTTHNRLDIMYSNAGVMGSSTSILDLDLLALDRVMAVNVKGSAAAIKHAARAMSGMDTRGSIVCTASATATQAGLGPAGYTASKHALLGLVRAAAGELGGKGIRVNCVSPWGLATAMTCGGCGKTAEEMEALCCEHANLKGVVLRAEHVAEAALFLASDESVFISGHNLVVDGGTTVVARI